MAGVRAVCAQSSARALFVSGACACCWSAFEYAPPARSAARSWRAPARRSIARKIMYKKKSDYPAPPRETSKLPFGATSAQFAFAFWLFGSTRVARARKKRAGALSQTPFHFPTALFKKTFKKTPIYYYHLLLCYYYYCYSYYTTPTTPASSCSPPGVTRGPSQGTPFHTTRKRPCPPFPRRLSLLLGCVY